MGGGFVEDCGGVVGVGEREGLKGGERVVFCGALRGEGDAVQDMNVFVA